MVLTWSILGGVIVCEVEVETASIEYTLLFVQSQDLRDIGHVWLVDWLTFEGLR